VHGRVRRVEQLTPHLVRVVLDGDGLAGFTASEFSDAYVNLAFAPPGAPYSMPCDLREVQDALPRAQWPVRRRYSVREWDPAQRLLTLDIVVHGDAGVAGPWAANARPGDLLQFTGPSGSYAPDPDADWHLMVGDESALPAIAASLARIPADRRVHAFLVVDDADDELPLDSPGSLDLTWLHRAKSPGNHDQLVTAVRDLAFPAGVVHAFVHGEAGEVRAVRKHLLAERRIPRTALHASGYWRRTMTDEAWRTVKKAWEADVERDVG
jgi:NADPH-dependent ferric siderophore reductase